MNKYIFPLILVALSLAISSCSFEEDDIFNASAAERLNQIKANYTKAIASEGGTYIVEYWPTYYSTGPSVPAGQGYLLCMKFNEDGSVRIGADNRFTRNTYKEETSLWEIQTDLGAVLSFNSYNKYFHCFSDPSPMLEIDGAYIPTGDTGVGVGGDYEFIVTDINEATGVISLKGKKNGTYSRMIRLPEGTDFESYLTDIKTFRQQVFPDEMSNYILMKVGNTVYKSEEWNTLDANIFPFTGRSDLDDTRYPFILNKQGDTYRISFRDGVDGENPGEHVSELVYNTTSKIFEDPANPQANSIQPLADADMAEFYRSSIELGQVWNIDLKQGSEDVVDAINKMIEGSYPSETSTYPYELSLKDGIQFFTNDFGETYLLVLNFMQDNTKVALSYRFASRIDKENDTFGFKYDAGIDNPSRRFIKTIAGIRELVDAIEGYHSMACATDAGYNVFDAKFVKERNLPSEDPEAGEAGDAKPNTWFVIKR